MCNMYFYILEVGSFEEAKRAVDAGVDAIIVQGREAGGHVIGQVYHACCFWKYCYILVQLCIYYDCCLG